MQGEFMRLQIQKEQKKELTKNNLPQKNPTKNMSLFFLQRNY